MGKIAIEKVIEYLKEIKDVSSDEIEAEIIEAFDGYEYEGETYVIVSSPSRMNGFSPSEGQHSAYIRHSDSPVIGFELEKDGEDSFTVVDAWVS
jgi:hypothetical protein